MEIKVNDSIDSNISIDNDGKLTINSGLSEGVYTVKLTLIEVYLSFMSFVLNKRKRDIKLVHEISFLRISLFYWQSMKKWNEVGVIEASKKLNYSKMSINRCFDEIE